MPDRFQLDGRCLRAERVDVQPAEGGRPETGVLVVELRHAPLNQIGLDMLAELEAVAAMLREPRGLSAVIFQSGIADGFSAGADLAELHRGLTSVEGGGGASTWFNHASRLLDSRATASSAIRSALEVDAGVDLRRRAKILGVRAFIERIHRVFDTFDECAVPTIAAVHGVVFGGGFELALTCDLIVADRTARFAFPELRLGLVPGFGGIPRLERDVGNAVVRDIILSGRSLGAKRAHEVGLVAQLVAPEKAPGVARRLAKQLGRFDGPTVAAAKAFVKPRPRARLEEEKRVFCERMTSPVVEEALAAFVSSTDAMPYLPGGMRR